MSPSASGRASARPGLIGFGVALGAAGIAGAAGFVADRIRRSEDDMLPAPGPLTVTPTRELVVLADDGVPLHVEVDEPSAGAVAGARPHTSSLPTVVLSHGFCLSSACWVFQRRALTAAGYRVVVWDQRGHGRSEKGAKESYTIDQLGADLRRVILETTPEGDLALAGHSMGGMTVMALAGLDPTLVTDRVVAFGAISTSPGGIPLANGGLAGAVGKTFLERLGPTVLTPLARRPELLRSLLRANKDLEEFLVERYSFASPVPRAIVALTARMILSTDLIVLTDYIPTFDTYDKVGALVAFRGVETLVFNGDDDVLTPPEHSEAIVAALPGAEHVIVRDAGHVIMLEYPEVLNEKLLGMLGRVRADDRRGTDARSRPRVREVVTPVDKRRAIADGRAKAVSRATQGVRDGVRDTARAVTGQRPARGGARRGVAGTGGARGTGKGGSTGSAGKGRAGGARAAGSAGRDGIGGSR